MSYFDERLRVAMAKADISGAALARELGVTTQAVAKWTSGKAWPSSSRLMGIVSLTGCSLEWIMASEPVDITSPSIARQEALARQEIGQ